MRKRKCGKAARCPGLYGCEHSENCVRKKAKVHTAPRQNNEHHRFYASKVWKGIRSIQLGQYPLCERCLGLGYSTPAVAVDHVQPHKGDWALFVDPGNRQSLCTSCHSYKTNLENSCKIEDYRDSRPLQE